ncbi:hypothetical protein QFZ27_006930 [Inquilinus ginsengisoli]
MRRNLSASRRHRVGIGAFDRLNQRRQGGGAVWIKIEVNGEWH